MAPAEFVDPLPDVHLIYLASLFLARPAGPYMWNVPTSTSTRGDRSSSDGNSSGSAALGANGVSTSTSNILPSNRLHSQNQKQSSPSSSSQAWAGMWRADPPTPGSPKPGAGVFAPRPLPTWAQGVRKEVTALKVRQSGIAFVL